MREEMEIYLPMLIFKVLPQFPKVVFMVLLKMLFSSMQPWTGANACDDSTVRGGWCHSEGTDVHPVPSPPSDFHYCSLPLGHKGAFYQLCHGKTAWQHTLLSHAVPLSQWPQKFQWELWFFCQGDVRADIVHSFHVEHPSAWDYPDLNCAALELMMCGKRVLSYSLIGGIQIQRTREKQIRMPVLSSFSATCK